MGRDTLCKIALKANWGN